MVVLGLGFGVAGGVDSQAEAMKVFEKPTEDHSDTCRPGKADSRGTTVDLQWNSTVVHCEPLW
jgi:hypothetical protein